MNTKNVNVFELHVEKLVLALAAAGAGYMVWLSLQPVVIDTPGTPTNINDVEQKVSMAVDRLRAAQAQTAKLGKLVPRIDDYVGRYTTQMERQPLPLGLVNGAVVPSFVPHQVPVIQTNLRMPTVGEGEIATVVVPAPENLTATAWRGLVATVPVPPPGAAPAPAPAPGVPAPPPVPSKDQDLVVLQGTLPVDAFTKAMQNVLPVQARLPANFQKTIVYRIECQRRPRVGGAWSTWEMVTPQNSADLPEVTPDRWTNDTKDPVTLDNDLTTIQGSLPKIAQPQSYVMPDGRSVLALLLKGAAGQLLGVPGMPGGPGGPGMPGGMAPMPPMPPMPAGGVMPGVGAGGAGAPGVAAPPAGAPTDPQFWVVDDKVKPGREYQYRVRMVMYNPLFNWPGKLKDPAVKADPLIYSAWAIVPNTADVQADMYLFVSPSGPPDDPKVAATVFKWMLGNWYEGTAYAAPGSPIASLMLLPDKKSTVVDTGYTVVDVNVPGDKDIILLTPTGELEGRSSATDTASKKRKDLASSAASARPAPTTRPGATTRPGGPRVGPGPGGGGIGPGGGGPGPGGGGIGPGGGPM